MGFIYKITNNLNDKVYIGKTVYSDIMKRFKEHCRDYKKDTNEQRPLYQAMKKYGVEHFSIELVEKCEDVILSEREQYWIGYYKGYEKGYNATKGGDGKILYDYEAIKKLLLINPFPVLVAQEIGCSVDTVRTIAKNNNIPIKNLSNEKLKQQKAKTIKALDKNGIEIKIFSSVVEAAIWIFEQKKCKTLNSGVRSHIAECANGKRKSAYGYVWQYQ